MDLRQYWVAIRKSWWIILLVALLGVAGGFLVTLRATPQYASTVTFFISTPASGGTSPLAADQFATRRITSYVGLLSSDVTAQAVIDKTGVDLTVKQVRSAITGDADLNTVLLTATVTDPSPDQSLLIAQGLSTEFGRIVDQVDPIGPDAVVLRVISGPTLNPVPVSPRLTLNLAAGFAAGLILGVGLAIMRHLLDNTIRQAQTLREIARVPVLGIIPYDKDAKTSPLIVDSMSRSIRAEAFRQLRTNLQFIDVERPVRVLVVTSSVAHEAKSSTATNLAMSFAESGRRVLLIEADLRRPRVADYLSLDRSVGLTDVLAGHVDVNDVIQPWGRGLTVLTSGRIPPNPAELLGSVAMVNLLRTLRRTYDLIVIDTPPLLPVTDAAVAARHADGAVLIVRYGKTTKNQVSGALRSLRSVDARILGTVLTIVPIKGADGYDSYGGRYYSADVPIEPAGVLEAGQEPSAVPDSGDAVAPVEAPDRTGRLARRRPQRPRPDR